jgi:hypothetical protein
MFEKETRERNLTHDRKENEKRILAYSNQLMIEKKRETNPRLFDLTHDRKENENESLLIRFRKKNKSAELSLAALK